MKQPEKAADLLPLPLPDGRTERILLVMLRRMAAHGIRDASAAWLALDNFGVQFRRPLVLMRSLMVELAQCSHRTIRIAPCCAMQMTRDEGLLMEALNAGGNHASRAGPALCALSGGPDICETLSLTSALNAALADMGKPMG